MADNFTSYVGLYLAKNDKNLSNVSDSINNLRKDCLHSGYSYSIFTIDENTQMDSSTFNEMMSSATQKDVSELDQDDLNTLFEIFDKDSDGVLNYDELSVLQKDSDGTITDFSLWSTLNNYSKESISNFKSVNLREKFNSDEKYKTAYEDIYGENTADKVQDGPQEVIPQDLSADKMAEIAAKIVNGDMSLDYYSDLISDDSYDKLSEMVKTMQAAIEEKDTEVSDETKDEETTLSTSEYNKNDIDELKDKIYDIVMSSKDDNYKCPEDVIKEFLNDGVIDDETAEELRYAYMEFSSKDEDKIQAKLLMLQMKDPDATRADAIKELQKSGEIDAPQKDSKTVLDNRDDNKNISINVDAYVEQIHDSMKGLGTREKDLTALINNEDLTDEEFFQVVQAYEEKYGLDAGGRSLVTQIEKETSGSLQTQLTAVIGQRLANVANNATKYDSEVIDVICKEIYGGTAGQNCTADDFLKAAFDVLTDKTLALIDKRYGEVNKGRDLITDIKKDHQGFLGWRTAPIGHDASGNGAEYISRIKRARTLKT